MSTAERNLAALHSRPVLFTALLAAIALLSSCNKPEDTQPEGPNAVQTNFTSPADAGAALLQAAKSGEQSALFAIFGPDAKDILFSGDAVKDKDALQDFVSSYNRMHRWREIKAGGEMLYIGADNLPFPIPLGKSPSGQWNFDVAAGHDEILARRIGKDELTAIAACRSSAAAEWQYFSQPPDGDKVKQYTHRFVSDEGKHNGLYWSVPEGQAPSPMGLLGNFAKAAGYTGSGSKPQVFNGYYFRILTRQWDKVKSSAMDYIVNGKMTGGLRFLVGKEGTSIRKTSAKPPVRSLNP